jgi:ATP-dependent 26S proteasome regulatory subunit
MHLQVTVDRPDVSGRVEILKVHARGKSLGKDVDLDKIARRTPGFTGESRKSPCHPNTLGSTRETCGMGGCNRFTRVCVLLMGVLVECHGAWGR